jgi:polysaccharide chain length determinant protein (PEP-CTERM system associated)
VEVTKPESDLDIRIRSLEEKLDNLRLSYTEQHPDIVAIVPMIAQLKARKEAEERLLRQQEEADAKLQGSSSVSTAKVVNDPVYQQLTISLTEADANVAAKRTRAAEFSRRFAELQAGASAMPKIEADYTQLTRDYDVNKARYDELLKRRESAEITGDMESSDAALGFRVIDPPRVPHSPIFPNRPWLMTVVLLAALASGLGVAWLTSELRPTINDERRLRELTGLTVLGTVAMVPTDAQKARRWRGLAGLVLSALSLLSAYVALMAMLVLTMSRA